MKKTVFLSAFAALFLALFFAACKPDEPVDPNEEELITKVQLTFTDSATGASVSEVVYSDPDGDGGNAAVRFDSISLDSGMTYNVAISLFDESDGGNIVNITNEVLEEAQDHLFCYTPTNAYVSIVKTDSDGTFPVGITTRWSVGNPGAGTLRVELKHQPDGTKNGTCTPGSTDVQLDFQIRVN
jgi:hypothetical protein